MIEFTLGIEWIISLSILLICVVLGIIAAVYHKDWGELRGGIILGVNVFQEEKSRSLKKAAFVYFCDNVKPSALTLSQYKAVIDKICDGGSSCINKIVTFVDPKEIFAEAKKKESQP
jgi:hypothetical protein